MALGEADGSIRRGIPRHQHSEEGVHASSAVMAAGALPPGLPLSPLSSAANRESPMGPFRATGEELHCAYGRVSWE